MQCRFIRVELKVFTISYIQQVKQELEERIWYRRIQNFKYHYIIIWYRALTFLRLKGF